MRPWEPHRTRRQSPVESAFRAQRQSEFRPIGDPFLMEPLIDSCGDARVCQVMVALREIAPAKACTAQKRSRLVTNRNGWS